ncbi:MAG: glutamine-hydrolyzing GMP synthase [Thermoplasmatales archaeon]|nr:glutamine-hydrolyzing GMP synthase [Candidatus Thermoplasmatota archaeon]MDA8055930.1 glutamine-hydrolyzing GMP synthase [Thermoplasmatales archaeon]
MFSPKSFVSEAIQKVRKEVTGRAVVAVSGGIDSTVAAKISSDALGSGILAIYVDTGFMRLGENEDVRETLSRLGINYKIVEEEHLFLERLKGVTDPESKRKIIGKTFIDVFEREAIAFGADYLVQGTIAPDWIESGGGLRDTIKSHHNVGGLPEKVNLKIVEPLRDLYKDEVREIAEFYEIPKMRQPFPGPGMAVRIIGEITKERLEILKRATSILEANVSKMEKIPWQYFVVLLADRATGVHGDRRIYGSTVAIRCVNSTDGMTADFTPMPLELLAKISREITNGIPEICRVVYDITDKPPATIEWE